MMLTGASSKCANRSDSCARAATSISSASRVTTSPKVQISSALKAPAIIRSVVCHSARARLSGVPRATASSRASRNDFDSSFLAVLNCRLILGAKSFGETLCVGEDTDQAQVFGKKGREVLSIKIGRSGNHSLRNVAARSQWPERVSEDCKHAEDEKRNRGPRDGPAPAVAGDLGHQEFDQRAGCARKEGNQRRCARNHGPGRGPCGNL